MHGYKRVYTKGIQWYRGTQGNTRNTEVSKGIDGYTRIYKGREYKGYTEIMGVNSYILGTSHVVLHELLTFI